MPDYSMTPKDEERFREEQQQLEAEEETKALLQRKPQAVHHYDTDKQLSQLFDIGYGEGGPEKAYLARLMFHTMLPHTAKEAQQWNRSNGRVRVYIQSGPESGGLPYGAYPRLVFIWLVTEAYRTKSRKLVLGKSLSAFMDQIGLLPTGGRWGTITQLRNQMRRLFSARIIAYTSDAKDGDQGESMQTLDVARGYSLWWNPKNPEQAALWESTVELGEEFYTAITQSPYPIDLRIVKALKRSPLGLDLYTFLTYRVSYLKHSTEVSWKQLHAQFGADYKATDEFARKAKAELKKIKAAWPDFTYETPRGRLKIYPSNPSIKQAN